MESGRRTTESFTKLMMLVDLFWSTALRTRLCAGSHLGAVVAAVEMLALVALVEVDAASTIETTRRSQAPTGTSTRYAKPS